MKVLTGTSRVYKEKFNDTGDILPGLGDAGDKIFGTI